MVLYLNDAAGEPFPAASFFVSCRIRCARILPQRDFFCDFDFGIYAVMAKNGFYMLSETELFNMNITIDFKEICKKHERKSLT